jgi:hypothetical protein
LKRARHNGMIMADEPVMGGQPPGVPVDPACPGGFRFR